MSRRRCGVVRAVLASTMGIGVLSVGNLGAQERGLSVYVGGGPAWPIDVMSNLWSVGAHAHVGGELWTSEQLAVGLGVSIQRLRLDDAREHTSVGDGTTYTVSGDDLEVLQVLASLRWAVPVPADWRISPYLRGGVGYTELDTGQLFATLRGDPITSRSRNGFLGGLLSAGATYDLSDRFGIYSQVSIGFDLDSGIDTFAPVSAGLEVRF